MHDIINRQKKSSVKKFIILLPFFIIFYYFGFYSSTKDQKLYTVSPPRYIKSKSSESVPQNIKKSFCKIYPSKYSDHFKYFDYVNPHAPKGGEIRLATVGSFDKINPFTVKGRSVYGEKLFSDSLMAFSLDEPFCQYPLIVEGLKVNGNRIIFYIRPTAFFHNGEPITAYDIKETVNVLKVYGMPKFRHYYNMISQIKIHSEQVIEFILDIDKLKQYPLLPYVLSGIQPISGKQLKKMKDFSNFNYMPLVMSGPYYIESFEVGKRIVYKRNPYYWGEKLPANLGKYNFDKIQIDYYRDYISLFEAFKKGYFDAYFDTDPRHFKEITLPDKDFVKFEFEHKLPVAVQSIIFNMRNPVFKDWRVRKAFSLAFNFRDINHAFFNNQFKKAQSLFENTVYAQHVNRSLNCLEEKILRAQKIKDLKLVNAIRNKYQKDNKFSERLREANQLLTEAGFVFDGAHKCRVNKKGEKLEVYLLIQRRRFEKMINVFRAALEKIGVTLHIFHAEESLYRQLEYQRKYDMLMMSWNNKRLPGIEQIQYFGIEVARKNGSQNYMCLEDPVAENLAKTVASATSKNDLEAAITVLDRYIIHQNYVILMDFSPVVRMIYRRNRFNFKAHPDAGIDIMTCGWFVQ